VIIKNKHKEIKNKGENKNKNKLESIKKLIGRLNSK
jgi:hypothetical protein